MLTKIHHINLLVKDLEAAMTHYRNILGVTDFELGDLAGRGVRTARFKAGESWIVLVQPTDKTSTPGRHLEAHGEGLFLLSFEVESLSSAVDAVKSGGGSLQTEIPRQGLEDWQVLDLDIDQFHGVQIQLTEISK